jgi:hypothetical protein
MDGITMDFRENDWWGGGGTWVRIGTAGGLL